MKHPNKVVSSYACASVERCFFLQGPDKKSVMNKETLGPVVGNILEPLCILLKSQQNLYGIKSLYRTLQSMGADLNPLAPTMAQMYAFYLETAIAQAANQSFNYMLFECIGLAIKNARESNETLIVYENQICPSLFNIVSKNIPELISYAFQVLSMFVLYKKELSPNYEVWHPCITYRHS